MSQSTHISASGKRDVLAGMRSRFIAGSCTSRGHWENIKVSTQHGHPHAKSYQRPGISRPPSRLRHCSADLQSQSGGGSRSRVLPGERSLASCSECESGTWLCKLLHQNVSCIACPALAMVASAVGARSHGQSRQIKLLLEKQSPSTQTWQNSSSP